MSRHAPRAQAFDRRTLIGNAGMLVLAGCAQALPEAGGVELRLPDRAGFAALDCGSGRRVAQNADVRFAMCSTFKLPLAAAILHAVDRGTLSLDQQVRFGRDDLVPYAPVIEANLTTGVLSVEALCAAAVTVSDNVAANLLLRLIGGPEQLTRFFRSVGDTQSRLDRWEPELNTNIAGDPRDTTTPAAMLGTMEVLLTKSLLSRASQARLTEWLVACRTGLDRLRAGLPQEWRAGDKTGTSGNGAANDVAIAWPRAGAAPILIASFVDAPDALPAERDAAHAAVARHVVAQLA